MASSRRDSAATSVADHRVRDRRGISPTSAKPTSRPSSATPSPDKAAHRSTPSYLRTTASSRHDSPASSAAKKPVPAPATTPATVPVKKLTRVRSMERHPPAPVPSPAMAHHLKMQTSGSLKERPLGVRSTPRSVAGRPVRAATAAAAAAPASSSVAKGRPLKKKEIAACVHDALDVLETQSEPDVVAPAGEVEDLPGEVVPTSAPAEKGQELDDPPRQIEEHPPSCEQSRPEDPRSEPEHAKEDHKCVEELKDPMLGRPKSFSHVNRGAAVDDELQRKLRRRQAWETEKEGASVLEDKKAAEDGGTGELKRKEGSSGSGNNNVIEEAATKLLLEKRKNKVLALVGAFETVMQLQEPETPQHVKAETPKAVAPSAFERELEKTEEVKTEDEKTEQANAVDKKVEEEENEEEEKAEEQEEEEKAEVVEEEKAEEEEEKGEV